MSREKSNEALATECLRRVDEQGDLFELFDDDVELMYPKWGVARGKVEVGKMLTDFGLYLSSIKHDYENFNYIASGDSVCVEGVSKGTLTNGMQWQADGSETGRFCAVFEMHDDKVKRMFVYLDPDYCNQSAALYGWKNST